VPSFDSVTTEIRCPVAADPPVLRRLHPRQNCRSALAEVLLIGHYVRVNQ
jgi:hypothetical protein